MAKFRSLFFVLLTTAFLSSLVLVGCGGISKEECDQLKDLENQVASLRSQIDSKNTEKERLQKEIAGKDAKIKAFQNDAADVKKRCP
jgi:septal ring factor EnvC (AmiA/AmiB activator)